MGEREYSRIIHIELVASVRAPSAKDADRLIDEIAFGKIVRDKTLGRVLDDNGSLMEKLMIGASLPEEGGEARIEHRGVQFSYQGSHQACVAACTHEEMGLWQVWHPKFPTVERFNRKEFERLQKAEQRTLKARRPHLNGLGANEEK